MVRRFPAQRQPVDAVHRGTKPTVLMLALLVIIALIVNVTLILAISAATGSFWTGSAIWLSGILIGGIASLFMFHEKKL
jgi:hypothetical protein